MKTLYTILALLLTPFTGICTRHYVTQNGAGSMTGTSWTNAFPGSQLQAVINNAQLSDEIWVACGTYTPTSGTDRTIAFSMKNDLRIYGGFQGTENSLSERNLSCGSCSILSGEIGAAGTADNSYHVISNQLLNGTAMMDGFVVTGANDDRTVSSTEGLGGGIYNDGAFGSGYCSPIFLNLIVRNNYAYFGGGVFNNGSLGGSANPVFLNCIIVNNTAGNGGGGMDNFGLGGNASPDLVNCLIINNTAQTAGGIYNWGGNPGGGASPQLLNCVISGNTATNGNAGGIIADNANAGGPGNDGESTPSLVNTIIWGNTATLEGPQFYCKGTAEVTGSNTLYDATSQTAPHQFTGATNILSGNPQFVDATDADGPDNCWLTTDDGFRLNGNSPCINTGVDENLPDNDIAGDPRIVDGLPDIGAYERNGLGINEPEADFSVYPNPAREKLIIQTAVPQSFVLLNASGQIVQTIDVKGTASVIDLSCLEAGCYFLQNGNKKGLPVVVQP